MSDNIDIVINGKIYLYTHHSADRAPAAVQAALRDAPDRWDDPSYLARVIFDRLKGDDVTSTTGYGISDHPTDCDHRPISISTGSHSVFFNGQVYSFSEFSNLPEETFNGHP